VRQRHLRCYARGWADRWEAMCIDLDIAVEGASFADVQRKLSEAVHSYVAVAMQEDPANARRLLSRRAPCWVRWRIMFPTMLRLVHQSRGKDQRAGFELACPA
jgi:hypothetical protein